MKDLVLLGASGLAREIASADQSEYRVVAVLDDDPALTATTTSGLDVLGSIELALRGRTDLLVCVGSGGARKRIVSRMVSLGLDSARFATVVDDSVRIPASCSVGRGSVLLAGVVLTTDVVIGEHVVAMPNVVFTHDDVIEDYATFAAGVALGGGVRIGSAAYLGMNSSVRQGVAIGAGVTVGMGAVVLGDIHDSGTWAGVPARRLGVRA